MLNKQNIMNLVASSLYGFYDEILKNDFAKKDYVDSALPCRAKSHSIVKTIPAATISNYTSILDDWYCVINLNEAIGLIPGTNYRIDFYKYSFVCKCVQEDDGGIKINYESIDENFQGFDIIQIYDKCNMDLSTTESIDKEDGSLIIICNRFINLKADGVITDCIISIEDSEKLDNICLQDDVIINNSISIGRNPNSTIGRLSSSIGMGCEASAGASHAEGHITKATGAASHAEGYYTRATDKYAHAEGQDTEASNISAHAEGTGTVASGFSSHAEGYNTKASTHYAHAEGEQTTASANASHAEGYYTIAAGEYQHVEGKYNIEDAEDKYVHIIGNGSAGSRSNAYTLDWNGNAHYAGNVSIDSTPTNNKHLVNKKYVDDAIANVSGGGKTSNITYDESQNALVIDASLSGGITYDSTNNALVFS